jgi:hypothetical protein
MRTLVLLSVCLSFTVGFSFAAEPNPGFVAKAVIFDNDTGARVTKLTKNVGVRLIITNQSSTALILPGLQLSRLHLTRMEQSPPNPNDPLSEDTTISWPLIYMNLYGLQDIVIDVGLSALVRGTILPVTKAYVEWTNEKVRALKAGYYFPFLVIETYDDTTGITHVYPVATELIEVK